jgi:hypothetical protein
MWNKPIEYWIALVALVIYVASRNAENDPILRRVTKTAVSAGLTLALSPDIAARLHANETWAAVIIMAIGFVVLDVFTSTVGNRAFLRSVIRGRITGVKGDDENPKT